MKLNRIFAILLRFTYLYKHSLDRIADVFYWPTIDLILWGLASSFFAQGSDHPASIVLMIVSGLLFWQIVWRAQIEVTINILEDIWEKNYVNIFVSPIRFSEWVASLLILGIYRIGVSFSFALLMAYILYKVKIFFFGFYFLPFIVLLVLTGWWVGFFVGGFILRFGTRVQIFAWAFILLISPFSVVFYPMSILPLWAQQVALFVPTSYVFEGARQVMATGSLEWKDIFISLGLNIAYIILALIFFKKSFNKLLDKGLVKLY